MNGLDSVDRFARINVAANTQVTLRLYVRPSCCMTSTCKMCDQLGVASAVTACYAAGCCSYGVTVYTQADASVTSPANYTCAQMNLIVVLPGQELVSMTVYDLDSGPAGNYREEYRFTEYFYYKTPLRPASGNDVNSTIVVDQSSGTFSSSAPGTSTNNPTDPMQLTDEQAANGVQFFIRPSNGYIDAVFALPTNNYCIVVEGNAQLSSHTHQGPMAIGGTLTDGTPGETGPVAGHSYVYNMGQGASFAWQNGVTVGQPLPVNFEEYVYLTTVIQQQTFCNGIGSPHCSGIWVIDQGGCYSESNAAIGYWDLYDFINLAQPTQTDGRRMVVFIGEGTVGIKGTVDNRQFGLSIMAPKAHLVIDETVGYVDGCIVAKSVSMVGTQGSNGAGVQIHCNCYDDVQVPITCTPAGGAPPPPPCFDTLSANTCARLVSKNKCGRADAQSGCRQSCGLCGGCPTSGAAGTPSPPPVQAGCAFPTQTSSYSLITRGDAAVAAHSFYAGLAIGGTLTDTTPGQFGAVGAKSFVTNIGSAATFFNWADGVTTGQPLPLNWAEYQTLARNILPSPSVYVVDQGGSYTGAGPPVATYSMDTFCQTTNNNGYASACQASASGYNMLVVFKGRGTVGIGGTGSGRAFMGTILAPWAHVIGLSSSSYIDGVVIAKSFEGMGGMDQMHAYLYTGPLSCTGSGTGCVDTKSTRWCARRLSQGKCSKSKVRRKCPLTCGACGTSPPPPPVG